MKLIQKLYNMDNIQLLVAQLVCNSVTHLQKL